MIFLDEFHQMLLKDLKHKIYHKKMQELKKRIQEEIPEFDKKYQFADESETKQIQNCIQKFVTSEKSPVSVVPEWNPVYLCFLCGENFLLDIFIKGNISDFMQDYDEFDFFSPYLLILNQKFSEAIYMDDNKNLKHIRKDSDYV